MPVIPCWCTLNPQCKDTLHNKVKEQGVYAIHLSYEGGECGASEQLSKRSQSGYRLWDPERGVVVVTSDVSFFPEVFTGVQRTAGGGWAIPRSKIPFTQEGKEAAAAPTQAPAAAPAATSASGGDPPPPTAATESASSEAAASAPAAASRVAWRPIVRRELYAPSDETNKQTDVTTIESIESWAAAMLIGMEESTIKDYLDSQTGKYSEAHADAATKKHLASGDGESIERVNDLSESTFGVVDHYYHLFPNQHVITAAGVAQCIINHDMDIHYVNSRARKPTEMRKTKASAPAKDGAFASQEHVQTRVPRV